MFDWIRGATILSILWLDLIPLLVRKREPEMRSLPTLKVLPPWISLNIITS